MATTWNPAEPVSVEWVAELRERIDALGIDNELVCDWLAFECDIRGRSRLLEQMNNAQAVLLSKQIQQWHAWPNVFATLAGKR